MKPEQATTEADQQAVDVEPSRSKELLGCPWCGNQPIGHVMRYRNTGRVFGHKIRCETCNFERAITPPCWTEGKERDVMDAAKEQLIEWWNSRKQPNADFREPAQRQAHPMTAAAKTLKSRKTPNAAVIAGAATCSEFEVEVLKVIAASRGNVNASWLAAKMWPEAKGKWFGARSGRWQRMGAILQRLHNRKLLWREVTEHNQKLWTISTEGKRVADTPNAEVSEVAVADSTKTSGIRPPLSLD